jgi:type II secretory pathway component PulK
MSRRGFALITVLWVLLIGSALTLAAVEATRDALREATNRRLLTKAEWARRGCEALVEQTPLHPSAGVAGDSVAVGQDLWCRYRIENPERLLNINTASVEILRTVVSSDSIAEAIQDWIDADTVARRHGAEAGWYRQMDRQTPRNGPLTDIQELSLVRGLDEAMVVRLSALFTVRGDGRLLIAESPEPVWEALPGVGVAGASRLALQRRLGALPANPDSILEGIAASSAASLRPGLQFSNEPSLRLATIEGGILGSQLRSVARIEYVVTGGRWARVAVEAD